MAESAMMEPKPGHKSVVIGKDGRPYIEAFRCPDCGAVVTEQTMACRACASAGASFVPNSSTSYKQAQWPDFWSTTVSRT